MLLKTAWKNSGELWEALRWHNWSGLRIVSGGFLDVIHALETSLIIWSGHFNTCNGSLKRSVQNARRQHTVELVHIARMGPTNHPAEQLDRKTKWLWQPEQQRLITFGV